jgi:hypothetical protein
MGVWQLLAAGRNFARGTNGFVRLTNVGPGGKSIAADAVRWVYSESQVSAPPRITAALLTNGQPLLTVTGTPGAAYAIEFSTNLLDWTPGATLSNLTGTVQFTDFDSTNHFQRFYRCRLLP